MARQNRRETFNAVNFEGGSTEISKDSMLTISDELGDMDNALSSEFPATDVERFDDEGGAFTATSPKKASFLDSLPFQIPSLDVVKERVGTVSSKVQDLVQEQGALLGDRIQGIYSGAKTQVENFDKKVKDKPYVYAAGAVVAGFALGRIILSRKSAAKAKI